MKLIETTWAARMALFSLFASTTYAADKLDVKIIDHQSNETQYTYVVPGYSSSSSNGNVNCNGPSASVNCSASATNSGSHRPARNGSYEVRGATFTLLLPDERIVVVNCTSKYAMKGDGVNRRSCRMPLEAEIEAEFKGDKAKLFWPVSIDGKKLESETYKILGVFDK